MLDGVADLLDKLSQKLTVHVFTADTFGRARAELARVRCRLSILPPDAQDVAKQEYVRRLGGPSTVCIGNGRNDRLMLREAALAVALVQDEGAALDALLSAHVVCKDIVSALHLLLEPLRLVATLRS